MAGDPINVRPDRKKSASEYDDAHDEGDIGAMGVRLADVISGKISTSTTRDMIPASWRPAYEIPTPESVEESADPNFYIEVLNEWMDTAELEVIAARKERGYIPVLELFDQMTAFGVAADILTFAKGMRLLSIAGDGDKAETLMAYYFAVHHRVDKLFMQHYIATHLESIRLIKRGVNQQIWAYSKEKQINTHDAKLDMAHLWDEAEPKVDAHIKKAFEALERMTRDSHLPFTNTFKDLFDMVHVCNDLDLQRECLTSVLKSMEEYSLFQHIELGPRAGRACLRAKMWEDHERVVSKMLPTQLEVLRHLLRGSKNMEGVADAVRLTFELQKVKVRLPMPIYGRLFNMLMPGKWRAAGWQKGTPISLFLHAMSIEDNEDLR